MVEQLKCTNTDCEAQILLSTAEANSGLCMPCVYRKENLTRKIYIEKNRKDINPYEGVSDPIEIIKLFHTKRKHEPLIRYLPYSKKIETVYQKLSSDQHKQLIEYSLEHASNGNLRYIESICSELAAFCSADLTLVQTYMLSKKNYYPGFIFKDAKKEIIDKLLEKFEKDLSLHDLNGLLVALAWSGNNEVVKAFSNWADNEPVWAEKLYIQAYNYSKEAAWEITKDKKRKNLYFDACYAFIPNKEKLLDVNFSTCVKTKNNCKRCNRKITNLFEIDLNDPKFEFLGLSGDKLILATCDVCSALSDGIYMDIDTQGSSEWSKYNLEPNDSCEQEDWEFLPENCLVIANSPRPADYAISDFLPTTFSQIGGIPTWVQDSAFPECPCCNTTMKFIAQLDKEDIEEYGEGIYYNFICSDCKITSCNYQQT